MSASLAFGFLGACRIASAGSAGAGGLRRQTFSKKLVGIYAMDGLSECTDGSEGPAFVSCSHQGLETTV